MDSKTTKSSQNTTGSESPPRKYFESPGKGVYKVVFSGGFTEGGTKKKIRRGKKKRKHTRHKKVKKL